jgi:hypothetical protein
MNVSVNPLENVNESIGSLCHVLDECTHVAFRPLQPDPRLRRLVQGYATVGPNWRLGDTSA